MASAPSNEKKDACRNIKISETCPPGMRNKRDVWKIDQFNLLKKVGSGYASSVYMATCKVSGNQVAIKLYHKNKLSELNIFQVSREIQIHTRLNHKNIIQLWAAFEDPLGIYLVSEFAGKGDVFSDLEKRGGQMTEGDAVRQVLYPFLQSLVYLHGIKIMHRDIKPENLLFTATGVLKVADFGLSIDFSSENPVTRVGTLDYMAPEVVVCPDKHKPTDHKDRKDLRYTPVADAWAVGVLAYELTTGRPPFDKGNKKATINEIVNGQPVIPAFLSEGASDFIRYSLTKDKHARPNCQQLMEHPWIVGHVTSKPAPKKAHEGLDVQRRVDSFVDPRMLGMMGKGADAFSDEDEDEEEDASYEPTMVTAANAKIKMLQQGGHLLGPRSMSVTDASAMRWRDIAFARAEPGQAGEFGGTGYASQEAAVAAAAAAVVRPLRRSDGEDSSPSSRRASYARPPGAVIPATGALSTSGTLIVPVPGGGTQVVYQSSDSYDSPYAGARPMSRDELLASLQPSSRSGSFSGRAGSPLAATGAGAGVNAIAGSPGSFTNAMAGRRSGNGNIPGIAASPRSFTSRLCTSSSGPAQPGSPPGSQGSSASGGMAAVGSRSALSQSGVQRSPLSVSASASRSMNGSPMGMSAVGRQSALHRSVGPTSPDALPVELARLTTSEPHSPSRGPQSPPAGGLRPQPPSGRSGPSRMSSTSSHTAPNSPGSTSRLVRFQPPSGVAVDGDALMVAGGSVGGGRSPTSPSSPGMVRPSFGMGDASRLKGGTLDLDNMLDEDANGKKSGLFGGLKKIVFKPS